MKNTFCDLQWAASDSTNVKWHSSPEGKIMKMSIFLRINLSSERLEAAVWVTNLPGQIASRVVWVLQFDLYTVDFSLPPSKFD